MIIVKDPSAIVPELRENDIQNKIILLELSKRRMPLYIGIAEKQEYGFRWKGSYITHILDEHHDPPGFLTWQAILRSTLIDTFIDSWKTYSDEQNYTVRFIIIENWKELKAYFQEIKNMGY